MDWTAQQACDGDVQRALASGAFHQALETLVQGYQQAVVGFCVNMVGDIHHGEDIAQDVFLAVYKAMPRFRRQASVRTWLFAIARRQCLKAMRDRRRLEQERQDTIAAAVHRSVPQTAEDDPEQQLQRVKQGLAHLVKHERALLLMRYGTGFCLPTWPIYSAYPRRAYGGAWHGRCNISGTVQKWLRDKRILRRVGLGGWQLPGRGHQHANGQGGAKPSGALQPAVLGDLPLIFLLENGSTYGVSGTAEAHSR